MKIVIGLGGLAAALIAGAMALDIIYPPAAAAACPACYSLAPVAPGVFVDRDSTPPKTAHAVETVDEARGRVRRFYGTLESSPRILVCLTEACYQRIGGGGSTGIALLNLTLLLSPRGDQVVIASHEMAHIELHHRLGLIATIERDVPQWFDEGLAALVSDDPRYLAPEGASDRCLLHSTEDLPVARSAWVIEARNRELYAKAACRVFQWMTANGGPKAVPALLSAISAGASFESLVR